VLNVLRVMRNRVRSAGSEGLEGVRIDTTAINGDKRRRADVHEADTTKVC
jgi:hypothetical protein